MLTGIATWLASSVLMQSPIGAFVHWAWAGIKRFFGLLDVQGWVGLALSIFLAVHWLSAAGDARHWEKQSGQFEQLYTAEKTALDQTVANYRTAADQARQADAANKVRVEAQQAQINERTSSDYQARIADARAVADRLRKQLAAAATNPGSGGAAAVPGLPAAVVGSARATGKDGLPLDDALIATEQAIQLDELIKWIKALHAVDVNGAQPKARTP